MRRLSPLLFLALLACAPAGQLARPEAATLGRSALQVRLTDGTTCRAALAGDAPWQGDLPDCGLGFLVTPTGTDSPIRLAFEAMIAAIKAGDIVAPMADIVLTDAAGKSYRFASPVPVED